MKLSILCSLCDKNNGPGAGGVAAAVGAGMLVGGVAAVAAGGGFGDMGNIAGKTLQETLVLLYVAETPRNVAEASHHSYLYTTGDMGGMLGGLADGVGDMMGDVGGMMGNMASNW